MGRWAKLLTKNFSPLVTTRCSGLTGGLCWLSGAADFARVIPPGGGATVFTIRFVDGVVFIALVVSSISCGLMFLQPAEIVR